LIGRSQKRRLAGAPCDETYSCRARFEARLRLASTPEPDASLTRGVALCRYLQRLLALRPGLPEAAHPPARPPQRPGGFLPPGPRSDHVMTTFCVSSKTGGVTERSTSRLSTPSTLSR